MLRPYPADFADVASLSKGSRRKIGDDLVPEVSPSSKKSITSRLLRLVGAASRE
jgi:hypothetical protein